MIENGSNSPESKTLNPENGKTFSWTELYLSLDGRVDRKTYWLFFILPFIASINFTGNLTATIFNLEGDDIHPLTIIIFLIWIWPSIAVQIKRWHDINKSGWNILTIFIPYIGLLWALIENGFISGDAEENQYGKPKLSTLDKSEPLKIFIVVISVFMIIAGLIMERLLIISERIPYYVP